jgi:hypothetical protein
MAKIFALLTTLLSFGALSILAGCGSGWHAPARTVDIESSPTLEQARQQLAETGWALVYSLDIASQLAGYPVAMFTSLPEGFETVEFVIFKLGPPMAPLTVEYPYSVEQRYSNNPSPPTPNLIIMLSQSRNEIEGVGGEAVDVEIGGNPGKKAIVPMGDNKPTRLGLSWSDGTRYYVMEGTLAEPLDEDAILRIAASVRVP